MLSGLVLAVLGAGTAGAHGPQLVDSAGAPLAGPYQNWVHASRMPVVGGTVGVHLEACPPRPELDGCVLFGSPRRIYLHPGSQWPRITLYHELGHLFDLHLMDDVDRRGFAELLRQPGQGWWDGEEPPAERFAEAYAVCSRYRRLRAIPAWASYGYYPSLRRHRALCRRIRQTAADDRRPAPLAEPSQPAPPPSQQQPQQSQPAPPPSQQQPQQPQPAPPPQQCTQLPIVGHCQP